MESTTWNVIGSQTVTVWPADNVYWPMLPGQQVSSSYSNGVFTGIEINTVDPPAVEWMEESATAGSSSAWGEVTYVEASGREVRLFTGGSTGRQRQGLFDLSAGLTVESELWPDVGAWQAYQGFTPFLQPGVPPEEVASEEIGLGGLVMPWEMGIELGRGRG